MEHNRKEGNRRPAGRVLKLTRRLRLGGIIPPDLLVQLIAVGLLALIPLLWFKEGYLITGVDIDFPIAPLTRIDQRSYAWNPVFLGGMDRSLDLATLFYVSVQEFFYILTQSLAWAERLAFVFWAFVTGACFLFLLRQLFPNKVHASALIVGVALYMVNYYQVYIWEMVRLGEGAGPILLPGLLAVLVAWHRRAIGAFRAILLTAILGVIGSQVGLQPPIQAVIIFVLFSFALYLVLAQLAAGRALRKAARPLLLLMGVVVVFALVNLFWILPVSAFVLNAGYISTARSVEIFAGQGLLEWTSSSASFLNSFRLQGDIFWYDGWGGVPYYPAIFQRLQDPLTIVAGFAFAAYGVAAVGLNRRSITTYFGSLFLLGLFLGKGIHEPFGGVFAWLYENFPGFWVFRGAWQKFTLMSLVAFGVLGTTTTVEILARMRERMDRPAPAGRPRWARVPGGHRTAVAALVLGLVALNLAYNQSYVLGEMFPTTEERQVLPGFHQAFPDYLFEAAAWVNDQPGDFRLMTLPDDRTNAYTWGYGAPKDITLDLFTKGVLQRHYGEGTAPPHPVDELRGLAVHALYDGYGPNASRLLSLMNVRYVLQRNDFLYSLYGDSDSPEFVGGILEAQPHLRLVRSFGEWDFYETDAWSPGPFACADLVILRGDDLLLVPLTSWTNFGGCNPFYFLGEEKGATDLSRIGLRKTAVLDDSRLFSRLPLDDLAEADTVIHLLKDDFRAEARYYVGWKDIIRTDGQGEPDVLVFASPEDAPYRFPGGPSWAAFNSTLVYIRTTNVPLRIDRIVDGSGARLPDIVGVWWETGWSGMGTKPLDSPILIPPNERAIIQVNHIVTDRVALISGDLDIPLEVADGWTVPPSSEVTDRAPFEYASDLNLPVAGTYRLYADVTSDTMNDVTTIELNGQVISVAAEETNRTLGLVGAFELLAGTLPFRMTGGAARAEASPGAVEPFNWSLAVPGEIAARTYIGSKGVISTNGDGDPDMFVFETPQEAPYVFLGPQSWGAYNSTLVYVRTTDRPLQIDRITDSEGRRVTDLTGVWWETGWMGMGTKPIEYPIVIPPDERAILQINHIVRDRVDLVTAIGMEDRLYLRWDTDLSEGEPFALPTPLRARLVRSDRLDPTKFEIEVESDRPFILVMPENYNSQWAGWLGRRDHLELTGGTWTLLPQFLVNGYANAWYVDWTGPIAITLLFSSQGLREVGVLAGAVSTTLLLAATTPYGLRTLHVARRAMWRKVKGRKALERRGLG